MPISAQLKTATDGLHQQTEALMPAAALMDGTLDIKAYGQLLSRLYSIHSQIEEEVEKALGSHPSMAAFYQEKLSWLAEDLTAMGLPIPPHSTGQVDMQSTNTSAAQLAGMMYVLEGSTLGGQVIMKGLKKNEALGHLPHRYYTGYGHLTGPKWKSFLEMLEEKVMPHEVDEAVEGANHAFRMFMNHLHD